MFGFFKKKGAEKRPQNGSAKGPAYPSESQWEGYEGQHNGKLLFFARNEAASSLSGHPDYQYRLGVIVPFNDPDENGIPKQQEMEQLTAMERTLSSKLEMDQLALQVLTITTPGLRQFIFYTWNPTAAQTVVEKLQFDFNSHQMQPFIEEDPNWEVYQHFAK